MSVQIIQCDARALPLRDESVDCCVTSPPYYGLRDYQTDGQIGLEATPAEYVAQLVAAMGEVRRVLRPEGTLWLNLGDSYVAAPRGNRPGGVSTSGLTNPGRQDRIPRGGPRGGIGDGFPASSRDIPPAGLKSKDLIGIPWRVAFALQAGGWWLRSDIIWSKPNSMPESVTDRPTKAHEYVFLLTKSERYHYDDAAIAEPAVRTDARAWTDGGSQKQRGHGRRHTGFNGRYAENIRVNGPPQTRNARSVWTIATKPYSGAHFATMPEALVEPCVLAGCPEGGTVLDPFAGSGTVGRVAVRHRRRAILCDLNATYLRELATERTRDVQIELPTRGVA